MAKVKALYDKNLRKYIILGVNIKELLSPHYFLAEDHTEEVNSGVRFEELKPIAFWYEFVSKYHDLAIKVKGRVRGVENVPEGEERENLLILSFRGAESLFKVSLEEKTRSISYAPVFVHKRLRVSDVPPSLFGLVYAIKALGGDNFGVVVSNTDSVFSPLQVLAFRPHSIGSLAVMGAMFFYDKVREKFGGKDKRDTINRFVKYLSAAGESFDFASLIGLLFGKGDTLCLECGSPIFMSPKRGFCCEEHRNRLKARYAVRRRKDKSLPELKEVIDDYLERLKEAKDPKSIWLEIREEYGLNPERRGRKPRTKDR